jgi:hypothetical protein
MPDGGTVFIDYADAFGSAVVNGTEWRWEFHRYLGPLWLKKDGEPRACQCPTIPAVWDAFDEWRKRFERGDKARRKMAAKK